jgi:hypothetical protein
MMYEQEFSTSIKSYDIGVTFLYSCFPKTHARGAALYPPTTRDRQKKEVKKELA